MTKTTTAFLAALLGIGCAHNEPATETPVVRSAAPRQPETAIANYFDANARTPDPNRELVIGAAQPSACPIAGGAGGYLGWVVPVEYKTRTPGSTVVTITSHFFWFSGEVIRGVTQRLEVCP